METLAMYLAVILTFAVWSYLWKENIAFRIAEHIYVGLAASYSVVNSWHNYLKPTIQNDILPTEIRLYINVLMAFNYTHNRKGVVSRIPIAGSRLWYRLRSSHRSAFHQVALMPVMNIIQKDGAAI